MLTDIFVSTRILPEIGRRIEARSGPDGVLRPLPYPIRRCPGGYRSAATGEVVTEQLIDWRDWSFAGSPPKAEKRPTPRVDAGLRELVGGAIRRDWYARPVEAGTLGVKIGEALCNKVRAGLLPRR